MFWEHRGEAPSLAWSLRRRTWHQVHLLRGSYQAGTYFSPVKNKSEEECPKQREEQAQKPENKRMVFWETEWASVWLEPRIYRVWRLSSPGTGAGEWRKWWDNRTERPVRLHLKGFSRWGKKCTVTLREAGSLKDFKQERDTIRTEF